MKFFKEIQQPVTEATRPDAYQRDEINATSGFGKNSYAYQMDGGANDEDHEGDRRREQQVQSGTWYVRINGKIVKDKQGQPYTFRGKAAANKAALTMQAKPFNQGKEIMLTTNPNDKVSEGAESGAYYSEQVAQQIFDKRQDITSEEEVLNQAYHIVANELGQKTARYKFNYDEDFPSDVVSNYFHLQKQGVSEGVAETMPMRDAVDYLRQYGADHFKTTTNELHFYKNGQPFSVDLVMNPDTTRSVTLSSLNSARRGLTGQGVAEGSLNESDSPVAGAITRRILQQRHDLLSTYGPVKVMAAIDDVADFVGDTEEIGSSDVSAWVKQVEQTLAGMGEGIEEDTISQMRDYFSRNDDSVDVSREYSDPVRKEPPVGIPPEIQALVNKMFHNGKITQQEFQILKNFQKKTKINVGVKEADMSTGNQGYDSMLAVMKAVDAGHDATFNLGGEPITLDYNEARFLAGRYKAFLKAGRQEEFLKYMESPVAFDRLMKQLRDLMDKQRNFRGSVPGERGVEEGVVDTIKAGAKKAFDVLTGGDDEQLLQRLEKETGGKRPEKKETPPVKENEYYCRLDNVVKEIPEGYKRTADGYITRIQG